MSSFIFKFTVVSVSGVVRAGGLALGILKGVCIDEEATALREMSFVQGISILSLTVRLLF